MATSVFYPAGARGHANYGWLDANYSFSYAHYYNPQRMHFGVLRVLNDDTIAGGTGFGTHPHDNMEIITIPLVGALEHKDSMGNSGVIHAGDVQIMSAGTGIQHSEFNHYPDSSGSALQIWILPKLREITPRYEQKTFPVADRINRFQTVVAPDDETALWINQDAYLSLASLEKGFAGEYKIQREGNGAYIFVIEGEITVGEQKLGRRDALGLREVTSFNFIADADAEVLVLDVPMVINR